jgi:hypothetical protein
MANANAAGPANFAGLVPGGWFGGGGVGVFGGGGGGGYCGGGGGGGVFGGGGGYCGGGGGVFGDGGVFGGGGGGGATATASSMAHAAHVAAFHRYWSDNVAMSDANANATINGATASPPPASGHAPLPGWFGGVPIVGGDPASTHAAHVAAIHRYWGDILAVTNANDATSNVVGGIADAAAAAVPGRGTTASRTGGENATTSPSSWSMAAVDVDRSALPRAMPTPLPPPREKGKSRTGGGETTGGERRRRRRHRRSRRGWGERCRSHPPRGGKEVEEEEEEDAPRRRAATRGRERGGYRIPRCRRRGERRRSPPRKIEGEGEVRQAILV